MQCTACGRNHAPAITLLGCVDCGAPLSVSYADTPGGDAPLLPGSALESPVSLGEGGTPLVRLDSLAADLGLSDVTARLEFLSPTGSFKDRGSAVLISMARAFGVTAFVEDSSGNAGASLAAYAAAAGITAHVFAPSSAGQGKKDQISVFGATLHEVDGPRQASTDAAAEYARAHDLPWLSHNLTPYFMEGMKSFAYEVSDEPTIMPDHIVFPVGNGSLIGGAYRGLKELIEAGRIESIPRLHCVQSRAVQPVVALINGEEWVPEGASATLASGIAVTQPPRAREIASYVQDSGGAGVAVDERAILHWQRRLAAEAGIFAEATSAVAFAGLELLVLNGRINRGGSVEVPVTGSGLKEPLRTD